MLPKTGHYIFPTGPKGRVWDVGYASRSILKYTKYPDICKQFLLDSMDVKKMDQELSVSQWAPVLKSYLPFEVWNRTDYMQALIELATKGNPEGHPDVFNDAWREQSTHTTISRLLQRLVLSLYRQLGRTPPWLAVTSSIGNKRINACTGNHGERAERAGEPVVLTDTHAR